MRRWGAQGKGSLGVPLAFIHLDGFSQHYKISRTLSVAALISPAESYYHEKGETVLQLAERASWQPQVLSINFIRASCYIATRLFWC